MCNVRMGYLVELSEKKGFFEPYGEEQKFLMTASTLAEVLAKKPRIYIISAKSVNMEDHKNIREWRIDNE